MRLGTADYAKNATVAGKSSTHLIGCSMVVRIGRRVQNASGLAMPPKVKPIVIAASEAARRSISAEQQRKKIAQRMAVLAKRQHETAVAKALASVPRHLKEINDQIQAAIKTGDNAVTAHFNVSPTSGPVCEAITKELKKLGYQVAAEFREYDENMGDFNAPCNVHVSEVILTISWKRTP